MISRVFLIMIAGVLCGLPSGAQQLPGYAPSAHASYLKNIFRLNENTNKVRSTQRTTGQSTRDNGFQTFTDSVQVSYGPGGASSFDLNMLNYAYNDPYQSSPLFEYAGNFTVPQVTYQQLKRWTINPNTLTFGFYQAEQTGYDANLNLLADTNLYADSSQRPNRICRNTFSASNKIKVRYENKWKAGKSDSAAKRFFLYDGQDRLIRDSIYHYVSGTWKLYARTVYTYSLAAQPIKISCFSRYFDSTYTKPLAEVLRYDNTFDPSNRLLTVRTRYYDGNALLPYVIDSFAYTATLNFHTSWKQYQFDPLNNNWHRISFMHKTLNSSNLPDTVFFDTYDSLKKKWVPYIRYNLMYDLNDNPVQLDEYDHNFVAFPATPDFTTRYFYENYSATTSTGGVQEQVALPAHPNPFSSFTVIDISSAVVNEGDELKLILLDEAGRMMNCQAELSAGKIVVSSDLPSGIYFFSVTSKERVIGQGKVVAVKK